MVLAYSGVQKTIKKYTNSIKFTTFHLTHDYKSYGSGVNQAVILSCGENKYILMLTLPFSLTGWNSRTSSTVDQAIN